MTEMVPMLQTFREGSMRTGDGEVWHNSIVSIASDFVLSFKSFVIMVCIRHLWGGGRGEGKRINKEKK